jgi:hypothetical protein
MKKKKKQAKKLRRILAKLKRSMREYEKQREKFIEDIPFRVWNKQF